MHEKGLKSKQDEVINLKEQLYPHDAVNELVIREFCEGDKERYWFFTLSLPMLSVAITEIVQNVIKKDPDYKFSNIVQRYYDEEAQMLEFPWDGHVRLDINDSSLPTIEIPVEEENQQSCQGNTHGDSNIEGIQRIISLIHHLQTFRTLPTMKWVPKIPLGAGDNDSGKQDIQMKGHPPILEMNKEQQRFLINLFSEIRENVPDNSNAKEMVNDLVVQELAWGIVFPCI